MNKQILTILMKIKKIDSENNIFLDHKRFLSCFRDMARNDRQLVAMGEFLRDIIRDFNAFDELCLARDNNIQHKDKVLVNKICERKLSDRVHTERAVAYLAHVAEYKTFKEPSISLPPSPSKPIVKPKTTKTDSEHHEPIWSKVARLFCRTIAIIIAIFSALIFAPYIGDSLFFIIPTIFAALFILGAMGCETELKGELKDWLTKASAWKNFRFILVSVIGIVVWGYIFFAELVSISEGTSIFASGLEISELFIYGLFLMVLGPHCAVFDYIYVGSVAEYLFKPTVIATIVSVIICGVFAVINNIDGIGGFFGWLILVPVNFFVFAISLPLPLIWGNLVFAYTSPKT